ncbi:hypothetical protein L7F22_057308 [Adiantum nelumboides]|nr:hypothetical protein [Adiantum nelumboides]
MIWYFDSGASRHITSRKDLFCSLDAAPARKKVTCANNASYPIKGVDVLYILGIKKNLLSVSSLAKNGLRVIFEDDRCIVRDRENGYSLITTGTLENGLFMLDHYEKQIQACIAETKTQAMQDAELWHARFGHVDYGSLMTLQRHNMVHDLSLLEMPPRHVCEGCVLGKMHKFAFSQDGSVRATRKLQLVHSDVCGPMRAPSVENSLYFVTFIDDFSRFCWVYPLKAKSDVFAIFQHYVSMVENETGCKVQTLRTDRGGEYMSERKNRSLMEMARCMLKAKSLPHKLWMEAVACAAHVLNRCPTRALKTITPYESCYVGSLMIRQSNVYLWGTIVEVKTQDVFEDFLPSFVENQASQQVDNFDQSFDQHVTPHDVEKIVREEQEVLKEEQTLPKWIQKTLQDSKLDAPLPRKTRAECVQWKDAMQQEIDSIHKNHTWDLVDLPTGKKPIGTKWVFKVKRKQDGTIDRYKARLVAKGYAQQKGIDYDETFAPTSRASTVRSLVAIAAHHNWKVHQLDIKTAFLNGDLKKEVYVSQPSGFVVKGQEQKVCRLRKALYGPKQAPRAWYKARLVAKGYAQKKGIDYDETFAPTSRASTVRSLVAIAAHHNWKVHQLDIKTAFLNGDLQEEVYVSQPSGFVVKGQEQKEEVYVSQPSGFVVKGQEQKVCRLRKALYGLKQAPRACLSTGMPCLAGFLFLSWSIDSREDWMVLPFTEIVQVFLSNLLAACLTRPSSRDRNKAKIAFQRKELESKIMNDENDMDTFLAGVKDINDQLISTGEVISDSSLVQTILDACIAHLNP